VNVLVPSIATDGTVQGQHSELHAALRAELTRRDLLARAAAGGVAAMVAGALRAARTAHAQSPPAELLDGTLQAYFDTIIPGRRVARTQRGDPVHPRAIAGADPRPGAVEADALALGKAPLTGFEALAPAFAADLQAHSLPHGGDFLSLGWDERVKACLAGLSFDNPLRQLWEAGAGVAWAAFVAAGLVPSATAQTAVGYAVMGYPGAAPNGYWDASYRRRLSRERTRTGSLP
jgi:hypothetical protein